MNKSKRVQNTAAATPETPSEKFRANVCIVDYQIVHSRYDYPRIDWWVKDLDDEGDDVYLLFSYMTNEQELQEILNTFEDFGLCPKRGMSLEALCSEMIGKSAEIEIDRMEVKLLHQLPVRKPKPKRCAATAKKAKTGAPLKLEEVWMLL